MRPAPPEWVAPELIFAEWGQDVTVTRYAITEDDNGNEARTEEKQTVRGLYETAQQQPRTDPRSPGVTSHAQWYFIDPALTISEDDVIDEADGRRWVVRSVQDWPAVTVATVETWGTR